MRHLCFAVFGVVTLATLVFGAGPSDDAAFGAAVSDGKTTQSSRPDRAPPESAAYANSGVCPSPSQCSHGPSELYIVDPTNGGGEALIATIETSAGFRPVVTDIALAPDETLFGASFEALYSIDKGTATATRIGTGLGIDDLNALTFSPTGELLGGTVGGALVRIDPATGVASTVGLWGSGLGSSGDLVFAPSGTLYGTATVDGLANDILVTVDTESGVATRVNTDSDLEFERVFGLAFVGNNLLGFAAQTPGCSNGAVIAIDLTTGAGSLMRCIPFDAFGAAITPPTNQPPAPPTKLGQFWSDGRTEIPLGGSAESTVVLKGQVSDPDKDQVRLEIELRRLDEEFTGTPTPETVSELVRSGRTVSITRYGLIPSGYRWRARTVDEWGAASGWVSFDGNPDSEADLHVRVQGLDVSHHQDIRDWHAVRDAGYTFAFVKATEGDCAPTEWFKGKREGNKGPACLLPDGATGNCYVDSDFAANWQGADDADLFVGAYHFVRPDLNPGEEGATREAICFVDTVAALGGFDGRLLPAVDFENDKGPLSKAKKSGVDLDAWIKKFLAEVAARTERVLIIYTTPDTWNDYVTDKEQFTDYPLWIAHVGRGDGVRSQEPNVPEPWCPPDNPSCGTWAFWQYTWRGEVPGIKGNVDLDFFSGSLSDLERLSGREPAGSEAATRLTVRQ